jgi:hypothetical protein
MSSSGSKSKANTVKSPTAEKTGLQLRDNGRGPLQPERRGHGRVERGERIRFDQKPQRGATGPREGDSLGLEART